MKTEDKVRRPRLPNKKVEPPITGLMNCARQHQWNVVDLNPERVSVLCPVCAGPTSIRQGLETNYVGLKR